MTCLHCQGEMKRAAAPFHVDRNGWHVTLDHVPAWVCAQCGEPMFEGKQVDAIQRLIRSVEREAEAVGQA